MNECTECGVNLADDPSKQNHFPHPTQANTVSVECRVTGQPSEGQAYDYVFRADAYDDPAASARGFIALNRRNLWFDGPHLEVRTVVCTPWQVAETEVRP